MYLCNFYYLCNFAYLWHITLLVNTCSCKMSRKSRTSVEGSEDARRNNVVWNAERDGLLLDVLLEKQNKGNRIDGTWTSIAYANIVKVFSETIGYKYHK